MTSRIKKSTLGKALLVAVLAMTASMGTGCAIHSQAPIKEVAYDFSDAAFYDKDYAPSPNYASNYDEYDVMVAGEVPEDTAVISVREPIE